MEPESRSQLRRSSRARRLGEITPDHAAGLHHRLRDKPIMANQVVNLLSRLFFVAAKSGHTPPQCNPCRFIEKYPTRSRERFLSEQEFLRLGKVLNELEAKDRISTSAVAGLRLLMLPGCRRNEILNLRWEDVDLEHNELRLPDTKTGARDVPLSLTARQVLTALLRKPDTAWGIFGSKPGTGLSNLNPTGGVVREEVGLEDVRIPELRHSFASRALSLGESLPTIAKLLGHTKIETTARYAQLARASVKHAAELVAVCLAADLRARPGAPSNA